MKFPEFPWNFLEEHIFMVTWFLTFANIAINGLGYVQYTAAMCLGWRFRLFSRVKEFR